MIKSGLTNKRYRTLGSLTLFLTMVLGPFASAFSAAAAQEVTGNIQGEVRDQQGAVIPGATVTAASARRSFNTTTNREGLYRFNGLLPGVYTMSAAAKNFSDAKVENVTVELGKTLNIVVELKAAGTAESVTVTGASEPIVDVTSTKVATNVTQQQIDVLPKGLGFSSIINVAPGTRNEMNAGGFQIDGASGSENRFVVDGLDVTRVFGGMLGSTKNIPYDFVEEVQIKSAGYEAEFGGATGGVINVVTRSGANIWHGEVRTDFNNQTFRGKDNPDLRRQLTDLTKAQYFLNPSGKDTTRLFAPTVTFGGPVWKDRMWFFASYAPEFFRQQQKLDLISVTSGALAEATLNSRLLNQTVKNDYFIARLDYSPY